MSASEAELEQEEQQQFRYVQSASAIKIINSNW